MFLSVSRVPFNLYRRVKKSAPPMQDKTLASPQIHPVYPLYISLRHRYFTCVGDLPFRNHSVILQVLSGTRVETNKEIFALFQIVRSPTPKQA